MARCGVTFLKLAVAGVLLVVLALSAAALLVPDVRRAFGASARAAAPGWLWSDPDRTGDVILVYRLGDGEDLATFSRAVTERLTRWYRLEGVECRVVDGASLRVRARAGAGAAYFDDVRSAVRVAVENGLGLFLPRVRARGPSNSRLLDAQGPGQEVREGAGRQGAPWTAPAGFFLVDSGAVIVAEELVQASPCRTPEPDGTRQGIVVRLRPDCLGPALERLRGSVGDELAVVAFGYVQGTVKFRGFLPGNDLLFEVPDGAFAAAWLLTGVLGSGVQPSGIRLVEDRSLPPPSVR